MRFVVRSNFSQATLFVHFDFGRHELSADARKQLDSLLAINKIQGGFTITINGYCDNIGSNSYNELLSEKRTTAVKNYLLKGGLSNASITQANGHGEDMPLNENKTAEDRRANRRVEITISGSSVLPGTSNDTKTLTEKITDTATRAGTSIVLRNMNFYGGTPFLLPESSPIIEELISVMRRNPKLVIEIQGHICCIASDGDSPYGSTGTGLSEERARAIYAELIGKGIDPARVSYKGYGHSMPLFPYPEKTEEERIANRRVEIKIISK